MKRNNLIIIALVAIIAIIITIFNFNSTTEPKTSIDKTNPESPIQSYLKDIDKGNWDDIYQESLNFDNQIEEDSYTDYLLNLYFDFDLASANYVLIDKELGYYDILSNNEYVSTIELKDDNVQTLVTKPQEFKVLTPTDYVYAKASDTSECVPTDLYLFSELSDSYKVPSVCEYNTISYANEFSIEVNDGYSSIKDVITGNYIIGNKNTDNDHLFIDTATALAKWASNDGSLSAFNSKVIKTASFYQDLSTMDPQWFTSHSIAELTNFKVSDVVEIGNSLLGNVSFDYKIGSNTVTRDYHVTYEFEFLDVNGDYKLANMAINNGYEVE